MEENYKIQFNVVGLCVILKTDFWDVLADVYLGSPSRIRESYSFHFVHPSVYPSTIIILELWTRNHGSRIAEANLVTLVGLLTSIGSCAYRLDFFSKSKQFPEKQGKYSIEDIAICISKFLYLQARRIPEISYVRGYLEKSPIVVLKLTTAGLLYLNVTTFGHTPCLSNYLIFRATEIVE